MIWNEGFLPEIDDDRKVLILGSFPSVVSREEGFYYGNPRNRFWETLARIFDEDKPLSVVDKKSLLKRKKIALWDSAISGAFGGSADSDINEKNVKLAPLKQLLEKYSGIVFIIFNGKKSEELFNKAYPDCDIKKISLPSTSPANPSYSFEKWENALRFLKTEI